MVRGQIAWSEPTTGAPVEVGPSLVVRVVVRPMTRVLNPVMVRVAGRRHAGMAQVHHVGRESGRQYVTPIVAVRLGDTIVIPLTFGSRSDWVRNVRAAGGCIVRLDGRGHPATDPMLLDAGGARPLVRAAFSAPKRTALKVLGVRQLLHLRVA